MKLHGLWYGLTISLVYCAVLGTIICLRSDWDHEVNKVMDRLKAEDKARQEETRLHGHIGHGGGNGGVHEV